MQEVVEGILAALVQYTTGGRQRRRSSTESVIHLKLADLINASAPSGGHSPQVPASCCFPYALPLLSCGDVFFLQGYLPDIDESKSTDPASPALKPAAVPRQSSEALSQEPWSSDAAPSASTSLKEYSNAVAVAGKASMSTDDDPLPKSVEESSTTSDRSLPPLLSRKAEDTVLTYASTLREALDLLVSGL